MAGKYRYHFCCRDCVQCQPVEREPGGAVDYYCIPTLNHDMTIYIEDYNIRCRLWQPRQKVMEEFKHGTV